MPSIRRNSAETPSSEDEVRDYLWFTLTWIVIASAAKST